MTKKYRSKFIIAVILVLLIIVIGVLGYRFISGFSFIDSLYMTVITVTTVGYGEVSPLDDASKIFTIFLIISSIGIYGYGISIISEYVVNGGFIKNLRKRQMKSKIDKLKDHIILVGYGRNGKQALKKLLMYGRDVVVIEKHLNEKLNVDKKNLVIFQGDATNDEVLIEAGIKEASALISTLRVDTDNLFVVLSARQLNPKATIISRASNDRAAQKIKLAGADKMLLPHKVGGDYMASLLVTPDLVEFIQKLNLYDKQQRTNLEEISFDECPDEYHDKSIASIDMRRKTGCSVIGFKTVDGEYIINPEPSTKIVRGSNMIVLGRPEQIQKLNQLFGLS